MKTARELADEVHRKVNEVLGKVSQAKYYEALDLVVTELTECLGHAEVKVEEELDAEERRARAKSGYHVGQDK